MNARLPSYTNHIKNIYRVFKYSVDKHELRSSYPIQRVIVFT